jgi:small GTP-binding protein
MTERLLDAEQADLLSGERRFLDDLREALSRFDAETADIDAVRQAARDLDEIFLLVVAGEFNAGKSAVINALAGERIMQEGATPTTAQVTLLRYGETTGEHHAGDLLVLTMPAGFLRDISIVDTPGTNAVIRKHEQLTREFVPRADLVLFVTSVDRPFTESERAFLEVIRDWGKKIVIVLNKIDLLTSDELAEVLQFVARNAEQLLGTRPEVFPVAARMAFSAKQSVQPAERERLWNFSRFAELERYVFETLDETSRLRLKLLSPLGVAEKLNSRYLAAADQRLALLREDFRTTENIEAQLQIFTEDMHRDFGLRLSQLEKTLYELQERGDRFFDETLRLGRVFDLLNAERIRGAFEREVLADVGQEIDQQVQALIDWMVDQELRLWQDVMDYLNRRRQAQANEHMIGSINSAFDYNRRELLQTVAREARQVVESYDRSAEASALAADMRSAVAQTALTGVGALSLGTLIAVLVGTTAADITGVLAAVTLGGLGLFIIPAKKRRAQAAFHARLDELRTQLRAAMTKQFETELTRALAHLRDAIAPYTRFVRSEHEKVTSIHEQLGALQERARNLRADIERLGGQQASATGSTPTATSAPSPDAAAGQ